MDYNKILSTEDKENEFEQMILSEYANLWPDVRIKSGTIQEGITINCFKQITSKMEPLSAKTICTLGFV